MKIDPASAWVLNRRISALLPKNGMVLTGVLLFHDISINFLVLVGVIHALFMYQSDIYGLWIIEKYLPTTVRRVLSMN